MSGKSIYTLSLDEIRALSNGDLNVLVARAQGWRVIADPYHEGCSAIVSPHGEVVADGFASAETKESIKDQIEKYGSAIAFPDAEDILNTMVPNVADNVNEAMKLFIGLRRVDIEIYPRDTPDEHDDMHVTIKVPAIVYGGEKLFVGHNMQSLGRAMAMAWIAMKRDDWTVNDDEG